MSNHLAGVKCLKTRFFMQIEPDTNGGCWLWRGSVDRFKYGRIREGGKNIAAHRLGYMLAKGPIPEGKLVLHQCHNTYCVNPDHLRIGTEQDNTNDRVIRFKRGKKYAGVSDKTWGKVNENRNSGKRVIDLIRELAPTQGPRP